MNADGDLTEVEQRYKRLIDQQVARYMAGLREARDADIDIAAICVAARGDGVKMRQLASWVKRLNVVTGEIRSITRQALDLHLAAYEGRQRAPQRHRRSASEDGRRPRINMEAMR